MTDGFSDAESALSLSLSKAQRVSHSDTYGFRVAKLLCGEGDVFVIDADDSQFAEDDAIATAGQPSSALSTSPKIRQRMGARQETCLSIGIVKIRQIFRSLSLHNYYGYSSPKNRKIHLKPTFPRSQIA
jgi:hypothetical protein